jgi:hypothetical protein
VSDPTTTVRPEVEAFVAQVRSRLADLGEDEREELLGGLEADLSEQVAEGSTELGDPWLYAAELRAAAGLPEAGRPPRRRIPRPRIPQRTEVTGWIDGPRARFFAQLERHPVGPRIWEVVAALRPVWWVARAWVAMTLVDQSAGPWERISLIPSLATPGLGPVALLAAIALSTLVGLGRLWPGSGPERPLRSRLALLALNGIAVGALCTFSIPSGTYFGSSPTGESYYYSGPAQPRDGLRLNGAQVTNVFAYDAAGNPLTGVQLFRANGDPLVVSANGSATGQGRSRTVGCGWLNGSAQLFNVFPLPQREQRHGTCFAASGEPVSEPIAPFAQVPPVMSPVPAAEVDPRESPSLSPASR